MESHTMSRGIQALADQLGVNPDHVVRAIRYVKATHPQEREDRHGHLSEVQFLNRVNSDYRILTTVGNLAMRFAGRTEDAHLLVNIYKASVGAAVPRPVVREGIGTLPKHYHHESVQHGIRILHAAGLPPIRISGNRTLEPGFLVTPNCGDLGNWLFVTPDPGAENRKGFAGGREGYLAVMRWARWGFLTATMPGDYFAVRPPEIANRSPHQSH
ncbi:hypothetical protein [Streptomyces noursei]|uniref:hypothetical protein n=2 Tax=Streptomyces noursei TaxID=1971 RepID=UPI0011DD9F22|nr:hypothetical protein [Streptomyces noursei]